MIERSGNIFERWNRFHFAIYLMGSGVKK